MVITLPPELPVERLAISPGEILNTAERQSSETSNIPTHISFVLRSNKEKPAITARNKVLCHFYQVLYFVRTVLHCNGNIILEKPLDFMHCVASRFGYPKYRLSELSLVQISSDNRRSIVLASIKQNSRRI